ncbi:pyridoxal-phosphate dependent enzyme [Rhodophyticola sp.]|uniref:pyridoxal-phosphate dependent enzyme n=1 Tax=Rhodophyticola sp. TaxID=2680032 RepID=UPI001B24B862|nr:pyridoxal-phosphate dependent enzyme [Roseicyclus sp.]MBO6626004.1 pyridoxal-phosphate dependent enzyme [Roseicyclus sp.]MBO6920617.1 pyridoxal-phosphate dependent enzyme [Roseicyclus sp.]
MRLLPNPYRGAALPEAIAAICGQALSDPAPVTALLDRCPAHAPTPLLEVPALAATLGIGAIHIKDERDRMGLGSFKALGAAHVIARDAALLLGPSPDAPERTAAALRGRTYVAASAGNHGLSVAAGARVFGARAVIYLAKTVPAAFADRLKGYGAEVVVEGAEYEASMAAAAARAEAEGWTLLSDSTWPGYDGGQAVMQGYLAMAAEVAAGLETPPTHLFLQAGVGGLAAACAAHARRVWGDAPRIIVVEPTAAPALQESIRAGAPVVAHGPVSRMGRLDCKEPSLMALKTLARNADAFLTLDDAEVETAIEALPPHGLATSPSGGAGFAGLALIDRKAAGLSATSRVVIYLSEGAVDA